VRPRRARPAVIPVRPAVALFRLPRLVVAGRNRAASLRQDAALRPIGLRRAGQVRPVRLLPFARRVVDQRLVMGVVQPAVPVRRHPGGLHQAVVDHPAPPAAPLAIVAVAELVLADELALPPRVHPGAERLAVPPGEDLQQKLLHALRCRLDLAPGSLSPDGGDYGRTGQSRPDATCAADACTRGRSLATVYRRDLGNASSRSSGASTRRRDMAPAAPRSHCVTEREDAKARMAPRPRDPRALPPEGGIWHPQPPARTASRSARTPRQGCAPDQQRITGLAPAAAQHPG